LRLQILKKLRTASFNTKFTDPQNKGELYSKLESHIYEQL